MKTIILKSAFFIALTAGILTSCVKDDNYSTPDLTDCTESTLVKNREVSEINAGSVVAVHANIVAGVSDVIEAYVTSSDIAGNFFKSISFQTKDGSKAFSVPVDAYSTFVNYEPGRKVLIKMDGLYTDVKDGGMRIGGLYGNSSGGAEVGRFTYDQFISSVQRSCTVVKEDDLVQHITIAQALANDSYINKLIEFDNVQFSNNDIVSGMTYYDPNPLNPNTVGGATNRSLIDRNGASIVFRTSSYANFASKLVANGMGKVRGVLTKYGTTFQFMVRSENDIKLTNPRFDYYIENFDSPTAFTTTWTKFSVLGAEAWTYSSTFGNPSTGGMAKMSGFNVSNKLNEDWLISPAQDLSMFATGVLAFDNAYKFTGNPIQILVSNNYSGTGSPNAAGVTWTVITGANLSTGNYVYAPGGSGPLDLSAFTGTGNNNVYVAFKYTSTTSAASTWEIDNVFISKF